MDSSDAGFMSFCNTLQEDSAGVHQSAGYSFQQVSNDRPRQVSAEILYQTAKKGAGAAISEMLLSPRDISLENMKMPEDPRYCPLFVLVGSLDVARYVDEAINEAITKAEIRTGATRSEMIRLIDEICADVRFLFNIIASCGFTQANTCRANSQALKQLRAEERIQYFGEKNADQVKKSFREAIGSRVCNKKSYRKNRKRKAVSVQAPDKRSADEGEI